jgi:plastocyanin
MSPARRLLAVAAVAVLAVLPGCVRSTTAAEPGAISFDHNLFKPGSTTIARGDTLTFANTSSRALHIIVGGSDARPESESGAPSFGGSSGARVDVGDRWVSPPWETPGTYHVTCTLHPSMNLDVTVT